MRFEANGMRKWVQLALKRTFLIKQRTIRNNILFKIIVQVLLISVAVSVRCNLIKLIFVENVGDSTCQIAACKM